MTNLSEFIDHTLLKPQATEEDFAKLCQEAIRFSFAAACVPPIWVPFVAQELKQSSVAVCSVVGFPTGGHSSKIKAAEALSLAEAGATELDMVIPIGLLKMGEHERVLRDIQGVVKEGGQLVKVILETCYLTPSEIRLGCQLAIDGGAQFVKTSTGFGSAGATAENIALMRECVGPDFGVKASGGIRDRQTALAMLEAGANRLGTSASVAICA